MRRGSGWICCGAVGAVGADGNAATGGEAGVVIGALGGEMIGGAMTVRAKTGGAVTVGAKTGGAVTGAARTGTIAAGGEKTGGATSGGAICVDASSCGANCDEVCVGGAKAAGGLEAISSVEIFSGRRLSGFSLTDAISSGLIVLRAGRGRADGGVGATVCALVANDGARNNRAGTEASEDGVAWGAAVSVMARRGMAVGGISVRGMMAVVAGGRRSVEALRPEAKPEEQDRRPSRPAHGIQCRR